MIKVLKFLNEFLCVIGNEEFTTAKDFPKKLKAERIDYDKLDPKAKSKILRAYALHQKKDQLGSFRM